MNIVSFTGTQVPFKARSYSQVMDINYELVRLSSRKYMSIDRGSATDSYGSVIHIEDSNDYIVELLEAIELLRVNNTPVVIGDFQENIFGEHIDHTGTIECYVLGITAIKNTSLIVGSLDITLKATGVSYIGNSTIPIMKCLQSSYEQTEDRNLVTNVSYNQDVFQVDHEVDTFIFKGTYILSNDQTRDLFAFYRSQRGSPFSIDESNLGITRMFGPNTNTGTHSVIIWDMSYEYVSPVTKKITIELIKQ